MLRKLFKDYQTKKFKTIMASLIFNRKEKTETTTSSQ